MYTFYCAPCKKQFTRPENLFTAPCPTCKKPAAQATKPLGTHVRAPALVTAPETYAQPPSKALEVLPAMLIRYIFSHLDESALTFLGHVCQRFRPVARELFLQFMPALTAHGSLAGPLKTPLIGYLDNAKYVNLAVDQFPYPKQGYDESLLAYILKKGIKIDLRLGTPDSATLKVLRDAGNSATTVDTFHKMHDKIWVIDYDGVIVGSPNVSYAALEGGNLESFIHIRSRRVGALFGKYIRWLQDRSQEALAQEISDALVLYNREEHGVKIALAPIFSITDFVIEELKDATRIVIRQFLIGAKDDTSPGTDILGVLCGMAKTGVDIEIYIDQGAYDSYKTKKFVRHAVALLVAAGCKVYTQKPVLVVDTGKQKIQHDKLILAELSTGIMRTLIGSAGFTRDVICNTNAENFISTDSRAIFDSLMAHHNKSLLLEHAVSVRH